MKIIYKTIILFLLTSMVSHSFAQGLNRKGSSFDEKSNFFVDLLQYYSGNPDSTLVSAFIQVPYDQVQFFKIDNKFLADFTITVSILDEDKKHLITENVWDEKIEAADFAQTTSKTNYNISLKKFMLEPDKYSVRASMEDKNSGNTYVVNKEIDVRKFSSELDLSDIMLIAKQKSIDGEKKIIPNISRNVVSKRSGIQIYYELNTKSKGNFLITYEVNAKSGSRVFRDTSKLDLTAGKNQIYFDIKDSTLSLGTYTINIDAKNLSTNDDVSVKGNFISRWSGVPQNVTDLDRAIGELVYIATDEQLDYIKKAPNREEKIKRFAEFWKKKDPNPNDEENQAFDEYYNRIAYANDHFSNYMEGWKTDMGMVYVVLGKPDDVEHHPFDSDSKPYEIWNYYYLNRSFGFLDETGFGDYRLMNPLDFDYVRARVN